MKTGVEKIIQAKGGDAPAKNQTGVQKIIELLGGDPPAKNQTGVDKIVEILENGGGGGNPNRVQTITGTMATITQDMIDNISMSPVELYAELDSGNATAELTIDGTNIGSVEIVVPLKAVNSAQLYGSVVQSTWTVEHEVTFLAAAVVNLYCGTLYYNLSAMASINQIGNSTDLIPYAAMIPYTLTIIWHPLPDQS